MKNFTRILSVVLVLLMVLSALMVSASAAEFEDYYKKPEFIMGDVDFDNKVSIRDCSAVQKHLAKIITLCDESLYSGDVDGNGKVNISDATLIQKFVAKMIDVFPADLYVPEYSLKTDGKALEVLIPEAEVTQVMVTVEEAGYYELVATTNGEVSVSVDLADEEFNKTWTAQADGERYYIVAKLEAGIYFASISALDNSEATVSMSAKAVDYKPPYDFETATELKAGDKIEVKAGSAPLVYKVDGSAINENDVLYVYTEGDNSYTDIKLYDSDFIFVCYGDIDETNNSMIALDGESDIDVYYIVVTQDENGDDFTLCCNTNYDILREEAKVLGVGSVDECPITATFDEEPGLMIPEEAIAEAVYLFTPEKSGYYSFNYLSDSNILAIGYVKNSADRDANYILSRTGEANERVFDVLYLEEGNEYLFVTVVMLETMGKVEFSILESDEDEYNKALEDAFDENATDDETNHKEIALGESVELTFGASVDEPITYEYKFTAKEDCEVVIYSTGSVDACVYIMNKTSDVLFFGDDILTAVVTGKTVELFESKDFAVKAKLSKGETVYFGIFSFAIDGTDSYKFSVVNEADYKALV